MADKVTNAKQTLDLYGRMADALEEIAENTGLPAVTADDNGDVLTVVEGAWAKAAPSGGLVVTATTDDGTTTLDQKWQDIYDAYASGKNVVILVGDQQTTPYAIAVVGVMLDSSTYCVTDAGSITYETDSATGYPSVSTGGGT